MAPVTRASATAESIQVSPAGQQDIKPKPRKPRATNSRSLGASRTSRQQTLTQIDFVQLHQLDDRDEDEDTTRKRKHRRTEGSERPAPKQHTQTLTQLDFVSRKLWTYEDIENTHDEIQPEHNHKSPAKHFLIDQNMCPPRTPVRRRQYEVPSSQSPTTPYSIQSQGSAFWRSPLKPISINFASSNVKSRRGANVYEPPKLEIEDTYNVDNDLELSPTYESQPKTPHDIDNTEHAAELQDVLEPSSLQIKVEIEDSDGENDEDNETCYGDIGMETQCEVDQLISSSESGQVNIEDAYIQDAFQYESQESQSQRLSGEEMDSMARRSNRSDIIVTMHAGLVKNIIERIKDHDFRGYHIPANVSRMWIYEPEPASRLKYMMAISPAKQPGEVRNLQGLGNKEFNENSRSGSYAYKILQVYELANPVSKAKIISNGWFKAPPVKYNYIRPAAIDQLMANLTRSLFKAPSEISPRTCNSSLTESQEAAKQLQSTMVQFSKPALPKLSKRDTSRPSQASTVALSQCTTSTPSRKPTVESSMQQAVVVLNSQDVLETRAPTSPMRPDLHLSPSCSQAYKSHDPASSPSRNPAVESFPQQAAIVLNSQDVFERRTPTSPIRPEQHLSSGPSQSYEFPLPQECYIPSSAEAEGTPWPLTLPSSQILTMSQMLPESLMEDSIPPPPLLIEDSDFEEEEE